MDTLVAPSAIYAGDRLPAWIDAPRTLDEVGVPRVMLEDLALKAIAREREVTTTALADTLALPVRLVDEVFQRLRRSTLLEVVGMHGAAYRVTLTTAGRERANELLGANSYVGPVPVSLADYTARTAAQGIGDDEVHPDAVSAAFADLVIDADVVRQIGIAVASGTSLMLSGPSGTGKTTIAARIPRVFDRGIFVPHALEVAGEIITVFDPGVHRPIAPTMQGEHDRRWVYCERPFVVAGGELTAAMLDLQLNPVSGFYTAPPQLKASGGVFVVDDFGRQRMRPEELLNRWIVPLDRGVDYMTLHGGTKFAIPFRVLVVFATNFDLPRDGTADAPSGDARITDVAFLRRIANKVHVGYATPRDFHEIFRRVCADTGIAYDAPLVDQLIDFLGKDLREPLRPCIPRDLVRHVIWEARYEGRPAAFTDAAVARACRTYFALPQPAP